MLDELLKFYLSEEVGKQILKKIPYALTISLLVYLTTTTASSSRPTVSPLLLLIPIVCLVIFAISTFTFIGRINRNLARTFSGFDYKSLVAEFASIFEGSSSFLDDLEFKRIGFLFVSALANGLSITLLLISAFLLILIDAELGAGLALALVIFGAIYLVYDISSSSVIEVSRETSENILGVDVMEKFVVTNSLGKFPKRFRSKTALYILSRLIGPLFRIQKPDLANEVLLVYENPELVGNLKRMTQRTPGSSFYLQQEAGDSTNQFFVADPTDDKITVLVERSPKMVFPYLLDPGYSQSDKPRKGWISYSVVDSTLERPVGKIFIHRFKAGIVNRKLGRTRFRSITQRRGALQFFLFGSGNYIRYLKTQIEINSARVPASAISGDVETT